MNVIQALEALPQGGLTVTALNTLDAVVPGEWKNVTRFEDLVAEVCGPEAPPKLQAQVTIIAKRLAMQQQDRYGRALQVYQLVDTVDQAAAGAALVGKVGELFGSMNLLKRFTPKPDTTQAVDAGLKLIAELVAFGCLHGMPSADEDGLARFTGALADYARYDLMRVAAWVVFDGVVPLGPDFMQVITGQWREMAGSSLADNAVFRQLAKQLPGGSFEEKRGFALRALDKSGEWVNRFVSDKGITQEGVLKRLDGVLGVADGGLDYVAAALDASTNYFSHTGTQTVARAAAREALDGLKDEVWQKHLRGLRQG
ncbi:MAG: hypothetical protein H6741_01260 [Alphaproteobacteria bacterium]|nr:hypothetical protein [Alphaproteobacteria bacterium]